MAELTPPPFRAPASYLKNREPVYLAESPWQRWLSGVYERIGSLNAPSQQELSDRLTLVEQDMTAFQVEMAALQTAMSGLQASVGGLQTSVAVLTSQVGVLQVSVATLTSQVTILQAQTMILQDQVEVLYSIAQAAF